MSEQTPPAEPGANMKNRPSRARYDKVHSVLDAKWRRRELKTDRMMREVVDALWDQFGGAPYSWCGFYIVQPDGLALQLGPHRDTPACTPLALTGVCGRALLEGRTQLVPDVRTLGQAHIACDPQTLSEIVIPVFDRKGKIWAVLDVDSRQLAAFDEMDQRWLERLVKPFQDVGVKL